MEWKKISVKDLTQNVFQMIGDEWMLVTAEKDGKVNTMTASWGALGIMWGKTVATAYLRPQRYTKEFVDASETFTLSFFGGAQKKAMGLLGAALEYADSYKKSEESADNLRSQIRGYVEDYNRAKLETEVARKEVERLNRENQDLRVKLTGGMKK